MATEGKAEVCPLLEGPCFENPGEHSYGWGYQGECCHANKLGGE
jgi:hypothetical protein